MYHRGRGKVKFSPKKQQKHGNFTFYDNRTEQALPQGAKTLNEGMIQFDEEGIEKLVSVFDGDINGLLDKLNEMMDASKAYKNFSGISDQMDGKVKFVFVTE